MPLKRRSGTEAAMTDFILRTSTERRLYVEALLTCIDRGTVTAQQACQDIQDLCRTAKVLPDDAVRLFSRRIDGIIAAYRARTIDARVARSNLVQLMDFMAPEMAH